jgi:N6-L-threonylcarbamoyladenine synthase
MPSLHKGDHRYDLSYSGLKTAAVRQLELFRRPGAEATSANIAASFQKAAIDLLLSRLYRAVEDTGLKRVVAGGGVAANSYLRRALAARSDIEAIFPPLRLCGDNGAMVAGIACKYIERGESSGLDLGVSARVPLFRRLSN